MKAPRLIFANAALVALALTVSVQAQVTTPIPVTPTTPQSFKFKPVGESANAGATVAPSAVPAVKQTTYVTLGTPPSVEKRRRQFPHRHPHRLGAKRGHHSRH